MPHKSAASAAVPHLRYKVVWNKGYLVNKILKFQVIKLHSLVNVGVWVCI